MQVGGVFVQDKTAADHGFNTMMRSWAQGQTHGETLRVKTSLI